MNFEDVALKANYSYSDKVIELRDKGICDLVGIDKFKNLSILSLQGNNISDISKLKGLDFEYLNLKFNPLRDISVLKDSKIGVLVLNRTIIDVTENNIETLFHLFKKGVEIDLGGTNFRKIDSKIKESLINKKYINPLLFFEDEKTIKRRYRIIV